MSTFKICLIACIAIISACHTTKNGLTEVKGPFSSSSYQSNRRWFRATASGESINLETAKSKALLTANQRLASSVQTEIKNVSENYINERNVENQLGDFGERFQQMTREVMNQTIVGVVQAGEKIYQKQDKTYQVWVVQEVRKKEIYKKLKQIALQKESLSEKDKKIITDMIDKQIKDLDDND